MCKKFYLLTWKHWMSQFRQPVATVLEILIPIILCLLIGWQKGTATSKRCDEITFKPFNPGVLSNQIDPSKNDSKPNVTEKYHNSTFIEKLTNISWSPCENTALCSIMKSIASKHSIGEKCYDNSEKLNEALKEMNSIGVQFEDSLKGVSGFSDNFKIVLRFKALQSNVTNMRSNMNWETNRLFPDKSIQGGPRNPDRNFGGLPDYYHEKFLLLQTNIFDAVLSSSVQNSSAKRTQGNDSEIPNIEMSRFPYPKYYTDKFTKYSHYVGICFLLGFLSTCLFTTRELAMERELETKEVMRVMGMPYWIYWSTWYLKVLIFLFIISLLMIIFLKIPMGDTDVTLAAVLHFSDVLLLLIFLLLYSCATMSLCCAVSSCFSNASVAVMGALLIWFIFIVPYVLLAHDHSRYNFSEKIAMCLAHNTAMMAGFRIIMAYENFGDGMHWDKVLKSPFVNDDVTFCHVMIMLAADAVIYLLFALYLDNVAPGRFSIPKPWYFPCTRDFCCKRKSEDENDDIKESRHGPNTREAAPPEKEGGVKVANLQKRFGKRNVVVANLSLTIYEGQITVLLGHNDCGKTTAMSIITGLIPPTSGTVVVNGYNMHTQTNKARQNMGFCAQYNSLFEYLTVGEHIYFYASLKGLKKIEAKEEVNKYIDLLDLAKKEKYFSKRLSVSVKRNVCVAIALCGNSKVCIIDEPTMGMDPGSRRRLWDTVRSQSEGRIILLSTHYMDEADVLGDRIGIMADGEIQCYGSGSFLRKRFVPGYRLLITKKKKCDVNRITRLLYSYMPRVKLETNVGKELTYFLAENQTHVLQNMLKNLESNMADIGIQSYSISPANLEDVFMKVGVDQGQEDQSKSKPKTKDDDKATVEKDEYLKGWALVNNQIMGLAMKRGLVLIRDWIIILIHVIVLLLGLILLYYMDEPKENLPTLQLSLASYKESVTVITTDNAYNSYYVRYKKMMDEEGLHYTDWRNDDMEKNVKEKIMEDASNFKGSYIIGASFSSSKKLITAWFNNEALHSAPLSLQYVMNSVVKERIDSKSSVEFNNYPQEFPPKAKMNTEYLVIQMVPHVLCYIMAFTAAYFSIFYVIEHTTRVKHLQFMSGVNVLFFWIFCLIWDLLVYLIFVLIIIICLICMDITGLQTSTEIEHLAIILLVFGYSMLPVVYVFSLVFQKPATSYVVIAILAIILGSLMHILLISMKSEYGDEDAVDAATVLQTLFNVIPTYALVSAIFRLIRIQNKETVCRFKDFSAMFPDNHPEKEVRDQYCTQLPLCCDDNATLGSWDNGLLKPLVFLFIVGTIFYLLMICIDYKLFSKLYILIRKRKPPEREGTDDPDVLREKERVRSRKISKKKYNVVIKDMTKYYGTFLAVDKICLGLKKGECFGLLGANGAGKTTAFKMLTGETTMTCGIAWIEKKNLKKKMKKAHKRMGYCPQSDPLLNKLTGKEMLVIFGLLRGIPRKKCKPIAEELSNEFNLNPIFNTRIKHYNGSDKRRLSVAIALVGDPSVIFLDEPTSAMDPIAKRQMWNSLSKCRDGGKCLLMITDSIDECEALCTRSAVMVNGALVCLGTTQHLKDKYGEGFVVTVKVRKMNTEEQQNKAKSEVVKFMKQNFSKLVLQEQHENVLIYLIRDKTLSFAGIFGTFERGQKSVKAIEDYSISQSILEQVFSKLTKEQEEEYLDKKKEKKAKRKRKNDEDDDEDEEPQQTKADSSSSSSESDEDI